MTEAIDLAADNIAETFGLTTNEQRAEIRELLEPVRERLADLQTRLTAGVEAQRVAIEKANERAERWKFVACDLRNALGRFVVECGVVSHKNNEFHGHAAACPVVAKINNAIAAYEAALKEQRQ